jgi:hypothetical protein
VNSRQTPASGAAGRQQIEVNFDEVKELGLGHYQGCSGRRTPLAGLLVHRSDALEVAGNPSLAHRVARAQLVVVQTGKYHRTSSTTPDRGLPPTYFSQLRRQTLLQRK